MNKKLGHLIIWQHAPLPIGMLILFIALGAWTGFRMNQHWQMLDQNHDMLISGLKYDHQRQQYQDVDGLVAPSKQQYLNQYLQVYHADRRGLLANLRVGSNVEPNDFLWGISILVGIALIAIPRYRHQDEWLQSLGFRRAAIFGATFLSYSLTTIIAYSLAKLMVLLVLVQNIPGIYFTQFNWWVWGGNVISTTLVALILMTASALVLLVTPNLVMAMLVGYAVVKPISWFVLIRSFGQPGNYLLAFLNQHWLLGIVIGCLVWGLGGILGWYLSAQQITERKHQAILLPAWRVPMLIGLSIILTKLITDVMLAPQTSWSYVAVVWSATLIGLIAWIYQPRWSRYFWQVVRQLR
ncbi:ABC transporter permease [Lactiplantibacillus plantarum]|uniref:ABC transporter permease n=1 Tax=Lactiplantibacillus plantarum TaxID=1590 RepID=UPI001BAD85B2|nr:ABC transporter permease [Lactiplantibacillus plantarum]MBS0953721.1 ABC transporter permease [Lactiplantibacillus plantarum]